MQEIDRIPGRPDRSRAAVGAGGRAAADLAAARASTIFLCGNHEEVLLRVLAGEPASLPTGSNSAGAECLASYGLPCRDCRTQGEARGAGGDQGGHSGRARDFLASFADTFRFGDYLFVHAGIRPGLMSRMQEQKDLRWIRDPFLDDMTDHGFVVVHGHTITETVEERINRIGIDTGAYRSGVLTAMAIEGSNRWFLDTRFRLKLRTQRENVSQIRRLPLTVAVICFGGTTGFIGGRK